MCELIVPDEIDDKEHIARIIFSPSMIDNDQLSPSAFFLQDLKKGPEKYVSVWRANYREPTKYNVNFRPREEGDSLYGYAHFVADQIRNVKVADFSAYLKSHPNSKNPVHAGLHYLNAVQVVKGRCLDPMFIKFAGKIAQLCTLKKFNT